MCVFIARPTREQYAWQDMELGLFIHWFPFDEKKIDLQRIQDPAYQLEIAATCTCSELDTDQWAQSAVDLGARYLVFVAKHGMGFCRWRSDVGVFNMKNTPYGGDVIGELAESCRKKDIRLGIYLQGWSESNGVRLSGKALDPARQEEYNGIYRSWLTEVLSRYGEMVEVWFDGSLAIEVGDILQRYAPHAIVFQSKYATIRWVGNEEGIAPDPAWNSLDRYDGISGVATQQHGDPDGNCWLPLECDTVLRREWGWNSDLAANPLRSLDELMAVYYQSVGHGANLLINQAPNHQGRIIDADRQRMKAFGDEIRRRFGKPVARTSGQGATVELALPDSPSIDHVVIMEDIRSGERIRAYRIEGYDGRSWETLSQGTAVGHKRIDYFTGKSRSAVRLVVTASVGEPLIRSLAAFSVGCVPQAIQAEMQEVSG